MSRRFAENRLITSKRGDARLRAVILTSLWIAWPSVALAQSEPDSGKQPRIVAPQLIAPPDVDASRLQRIEPRPPLSGTLQQDGAGGGDAARRQAPASPLAGKPLLFNPVAGAAGKIATPGRVITIAGVDPVQLDRTCEGDGGASWPCGMIARTAFRSFLRGRAVRCDFPAGDPAPEVTASCRLGDKDVGEWLLAHGWAELPAGNQDEAYREAALKAEDERRGIHGPGPRVLNPVLTGRATAPAEPLPPLGDVGILPPIEVETPDLPEAAADQPPPANPLSPAPSGDLLPAPSTPQAE